MMSRSAARSRFHGKGRGVGRGSAEAINTAELGIATPPAELMTNTDISGDAGRDLPTNLPELLAEAETSAVARDRVITLLYPELRRIAEAHMRRERRDHTLQATGLVSEFFVHVARTAAFTTRTKAQFLMVAAVAMRRLLVDYARARRAEKRGGRLVRVDIDHADPGEETNYEDLIAIDDLLGQLAASDARMAQIVELRFFGGLTNLEIAEILGVNDRTVKRDWQMARAWLFSQLHRDVAHGPRGLEPD
jgi:RNA polymerase sigma factor (TIGR02999 family)